MSENPYIEHDGIEFLDAPDRASIAEEIKQKYWPKIRAKGFYLLVKMYSRPEKSTGGILLADVTRNEDKYHANQAQVIDIGPIAYAKREYTGDKIWAKVGDWVMVPRVSGTLVGLKNGDSDEHFRIIKDDDVTAIIQDPAAWVIGTPK